MDEEYGPLLRTLGLIFIEIRSPSDRDRKERTAGVFCNAPAQIASGVSIAEIEQKIRRNAKRWQVPSEMVDA